MLLFLVYSMHCCYFLFIVCSLCKTYSLNCEDIVAQWMSFSFTTDKEIDVDMLEEFEKKVNNLSFQIINFAVRELKVTFSRKCVKNRTNFHL